MTNRRAGLVCGGGLHRSFITRFPAALSTIGVVKASSLRVARRMANTLRAGTAVETYAGLAGCEAIWIAVPETALDEVLHDVAKAHLGRCGVYLLCDTPRDSSCASPLAAASICALPPDERTLVAEGAPEALRYVRRIAAEGRRKLLEIRPASKPLFFAGLHFASYIALPWIGAAVESLRSAGLSRSDATRVVADLGVLTLRSYAKAGLKAWRPAAGPELRRALGQKLNDSKVSRLYHDGIDRALRFFES